MHTIVSNDIAITDYTSDVLDYCEKNLIISNPDYHKAKALGRDTRFMQREYFLFSRHGNTLHLPFGTLRDVWPYIKEGKVDTLFAPLQPLSMHGNINLYNYQQNALQGILSAKSGILQAPCGSGKTQIGIALIQSLGQKALWITHTKDLLKQSMDRAKSNFTGDFGTITDGKINIGKDITFATVQTLANVDLDKLRFEWNVIIVDECHKVAGTPTKLMQFYKVLDKLSARHKIGLSATVHRSDALIRSTFAILGNIMHKIEEKEVGNKIIRASHVRVDTSIGESEVYLDTDGTMQHASLIEYLTYDTVRNTLICDNISSEPQRYHLLLCHRVEHLQILKGMLGDIAEVVHGSVTGKKRDDIYERMRNGEIHVLLATYSLAKEGLDIPILDRLHLATPQKDYAIVTQSVGRIERNIEGKNTPIAYDYVDENIDYCKRMYTKRKNILRRRK